jgi:hypothetical protein
MTKTYEIPAKFMLTTDADPKQIGYLVLNAEININEMPKVIAKFDDGKTITGIVRVHFSMPEEAEESCQNESQKV